GHLDALMTSGSTVEVFWGDGARGFSRTVTPLDFAPGSAAIADFDEDGVLDLAIKDVSPDAVVFLHGDGARDFTLGERFKLRGNFNTYVIAADFDEDGHEDVVVPYDFIGVLLNRTLHPIRYRRGNVNAAAGRIADVLFVNGSAGDAERRIL